MSSLLPLLLAFISVLASVMSLPQLVRLVRSRSAGGVSLAGLVAGVLGYGAWLAYFALSGDSGAALALVLPGLVQVLILAAALRFGAERDPMVVPVSMVGLLALGAVVSGVSGYGFVLSFSALFVYVPAIRSAWTALDVSGVSRLTWALSALYGSCWFPVGFASGDVSVLVMAGLNLFLPLLVLAGLARASRRGVSAAPALPLPAAFVPAQRTPSDVEVQDRVH